MKRKRIAKEKARERKSTEKKKRSPKNIFTVKVLAEASAELNELLHKFENMDPNNERCSLMKRNIQGARSAYKQI